MQCFTDDERKKKCEFSLWEFIDLRLLMELVSLALTTRMGSMRINGMISWS